MNNSLCVHYKHLELLAIELLLLLLLLFLYLKLAVQ